jgi:hypothetical protein
VVLRALGRTTGVGSVRAATNSAASFGIWRAIETRQAVAALALSTTDAVDEASVSTGESGPLQGRVRMHPPRFATTHISLEGSMGRGGRGGGEVGGWGVLPLSPCSSRSYGGLRLAFGGSDGWFRAQGDAPNLPAARRRRRRGWEWLDSHVLAQQRRSAMIRRSTEDSSQADEVTGKNVKVTDDERCTSWASVG